MEPGTWAQWAGAIATTLAVIVALYKDWLRDFLRRPKLEVSFKLETPHCHKTTIVRSPGATGYGYLTADCYYLRLWIQNSGKTRAEKVQVFVSKLYRKSANGNFDQVKEFLPMNLRWAHSQNQPEIFADGISPEMGKHCDFGRVIAPAERYSFGDALAENDDRTKTVLSLDLEVRPNTQSHLIKPNSYQFHLSVAAANCRPVESIFELNLTGEWFEDEARMFTSGMGIRKIK